MAMTEEELKNQLFKLSAQAIYHLSDGSTDPKVIKESIENHSIFRPILNSVQILTIKNSSNGEIEIKFVLSPDYLTYNKGLVFKASLDQLMWNFKLPTYDEGVIETIVDDEEGKIEMRSEEGVENWILRGEIEIKNCNSDTYETNIEVFFNSFVHTESE